MSKHWSDTSEDERDESGNLWRTQTVETPWGTDVHHMNYGKDPEGEDE